MTANSSLLIFPSLKRVLNIVPIKTSTDADELNPDPGKTVLVITPLKPPNRVVYSMPKRLPPLWEPAGANYSSTR